MVADREQVRDHCDLVRYLLAAEDRHEGPLRFRDRVGEVLDLLVDEKSDHRRLAEGLHRHGRRVHARLGAVAGAEGVVNVGVGQGREAIHVGRVVPLLLPLVEADILQHQHTSSRECLGLGVRVGATGVGGEGHGPAEQLAEPLGNGRE